MEDPDFGERFEIHVPISQVQDIVEARKRGRALALQLGFSPTDATLIAAAISELARNIVTYAGEGEIVLDRTANDALVLIARDEGPGIPDPELAMKPGYTTSRSLGLGLAGVRRIADRMEIESNSTGTTVMVWKTKK